LYGHPNLYGLFTHVAIDMAKPKGIISYLTPTSFLSGEYFKNLRALIRKHARIIEIDFIAVRKGVFEDVLQETMLASYCNDSKHQDSFQVNEMITSIDGSASVYPIGDCSLPDNPTAPWIVPKKSEQTISVDAMLHMHARLKDWGYQISTGQLVWNRYKDQLSDKVNKNSYPVIWSEAVSQDGTFSLKADKKNHSNWFHFKTGDDYLLTTAPCLLLQRTTAKEQDKRLIAAILPQALLEKNRAVVVENHLNMIYPVVPTPLVSLDVLSAFLNSKAVNNAFRTISGSVAVSAYELESLPIPDLSHLGRLKMLIETNAKPEMIEQECLTLYTIYSR
jgi:adenine-specific DNA-methyltransferase